MVAEIQDNAFGQSHIIEMFYNEDYSKNTGPGWEQKRSRGGKKEGSKDLPSSLLIAIGFPSGELRLFQVQMAS